MFQTSRKYWRHVFVIMKIVVRSWTNDIMIIKVTFSRRRFCLKFIYECFSTKSKIQVPCFYVYNIHSMCQKYSLRIMVWNLYNIKDSIMYTSLKVKPYADCHSYCLWKNKTVGYFELATNSHICKTEDKWL